MKSWWSEKRIDLYIAAVMVPSVMLAVLALWALRRQYSFINYQLKSSSQLPVVESEFFGAFSQISIFAFSMIIVALLLILIISTYISRHNMQRQLEVARLKSDFVSTVSHELKTPLASVRLLAERLLKLSPQEQAKQKEYHSLILAQSYRLSHLIANILDFSKLEQEGREKRKLEKADLKELVEQAVADYPAELIRPDCKIELDIAPDLPLLYLDKEAISRAVLNLLDNALKFSPARGRVTITVQKSTRHMLIAVGDQGPGIEEEAKERIFERFYHKGKGTGLGLTLVRNIAEGHNGQVKVDSAVGKGSTFTIILPIRQ